MATSKLNTLQIKNFTGVDRFTEGTEQKPDAFETIQNMFAPNPGELRTLNGVTKLNSSDLAGVGEFIHTKFLDTPELKGLVVLNDPTSGDPDPDVMTGFTFAGTADATTWDIYVQGVGTGKLNATLYTETLLSATAVITATMPALTAKTRSVNFWIGSSGALGPALVWAGSIFRKADGTFPATFEIRPPNAAVPLAANKSLAYAPGTFSASEGTDGTLAANKMYYFGIAPWFKTSGTVTAASCAIKTLGSEGSGGVKIVMSKYLNDGYNSLTASFGYLPYRIPTTETAPITTFMAMDYCMVYIGLTPEDMLPVRGGFAEDGMASPIYFSSLVLILPIVADGTPASKISVTNDTILFPYANLPVGTSLYISAMTITVTGAAVGQMVYVKTSVNSGTGSLITIAATPLGTALDITVAGAAQLIEFTVVNLSVKVKHLPHSLNIMPVAATIGSTGILPLAGTGRDYLLSMPFYPRDDATASRNDPTLCSDESLKVSGIFYKDSNFNDATRHDLLSPLWQDSVNLFNVGWDTVGSEYLNTYGFTINKDFDIQSRLFGNRLWMTNGYNEPFYTNGHVLKSGVPSKNVGDTYHRWPITKFIEFFKNRMILCSDAQNSTYDDAYVEFSDSLGDITYFHYVTTTPRAVPINSGDQSQVRGMNLYSQDLTSVGAESFLVVGKRSSIFVWGGDPAINPKQISKDTGFAGPNGYTLTKFGPIFVGTDNVYIFRSSQDVTPIGNNIRDIIRGLTDDQLYQVNCVYHNEDIKIGYASNGSDIDSEIWVRIFQVSGGLNTVWTGPHVMKAYSHQAQIPFWDGIREYRASSLDRNIYRRDDDGSFLNDGLDVTRRLKIRNLGLQSDQLLKLISGLNLHLRISEDEDFDMSLESEDGSAAIVMPFTANSAGNIRMFKQVQIPQRFLARVLTLTLENTNNSDMSIYDFSLLFSTIKRRLLP